MSSKNETKSNKTKSNEVDCDSCLSNDQFFCAPDKVNNLPGKCVDKKNARKECGLATLISRQEGCHSNTWKIIKIFFQSNPIFYRKWLYKRFQDDIVKEASTFDAKGEKDQKNPLNITSRLDINRLRWKRGLEATKADWKIKLQSDEKGSCKAEEEYKTLIENIVNVYRGGAFRGGGQRGGQRGGRGNFGAMFGCILTLVMCICLLNYDSQILDDFEEGITTEFEQCAERVKHTCPNLYREIVSFLNDVDYDHNVKEIEENSDKKEKQSDLETVFEYEELSDAHLMRDKINAENELTTEKKEETSWSTSFLSTVGQFIGDTDHFRKIRKNWAKISKFANRSTDIIGRDILLRMSKIPPIIPPVVERAWFQVSDIGEILTASYLLVSHPTALFDNGIKQTKTGSKKSGLGIDRVLIDMKTAKDDFYQVIDSIQTLTDTAVMYLAARVSASFLAQQYGITFMCKMHNSWGTARNADIDVGIEWIIYRPNSMVWNPLPVKVKFFLQQMAWKTAEFGGLKIYEGIQILSIDLYGMLDTKAPDIPGPFTTSTKTTTKNTAPPPTGMSRSRSAPDRMRSSSYHKPMTHFLQLEDKKDPKGVVPYKKKDGSMGSDKANNDMLAVWDGDFGGGYKKKKRTKRKKRRTKKQGGKKTKKRGKKRRKTKRC